MGETERLRGNKRGRATREALIETTLAEVHRRSPETVRLKDVAASAGMAPAHVLYHFNDREALLRASLAASEKRVREQLEQMLQGASDPTAKLYAWIDAYLPDERDDANWKLWLYFWLREGSDDPAARAVSEPPTWRDPLLEILHAGVAEGAFSLADPEWFASWFHKYLLGLSVSIVLGWVTAGDGSDMAGRLAAAELSLTPPAQSF